MEETGAEALVLEPVCTYSVTGKNRVSPQGEETFGMLFYAEVNNPGAPPVDFEMAEVRVLPKLPDALTYPEIQPALLKKAEMGAKMRKRNRIQKILVAIFSRLCYHSTVNAWAAERGDIHEGSYPSEI